jgi:mannose-6-phosphate isomerase-like protein (cupin superfamily)
MERKKDEPDFGRFDLNAIANGFPDTAETLLLDSYLTDEEAASVRVFRVYRATPAHYHAGSDEHLYVLSGRGTFWMDDPGNGGEFAPGHLLYFKRGTVHALPDLIEGPVVFLAIDTPGAIQRHHLREPRRRHARSSFKLWPRELLTRSRAWRALEATRREPAASRMRLRA